MPTRMTNKPRFRLAKQHEKKRRYSGQQNCQYKERQWGKEKSEKKSK